MSAIITPKPTGPVLRAENVVRRIPGEVPVTLINGVTLDIERSEFVCIMGPSGSGKSSLLYLLGLLDLPDEGRIFLDGEDTTHYREDDLSDRRLAKLGFVFQFHFLLSEFSVIDNVTLPMRKLGKLHDDAARARALDLLDHLGVKEQATKTQVSFLVDNASAWPSPAPWPMTLW